MAEATPTPTQPPLGLSLQEKVGQLLILGFAGTEVSKGLKEHFDDLRPGGVLLFRKNLKSKKQLRALTQSLQEKSKTPLFIAVDQEGGVVARIPTSPHLPSAAWIGTKNSPDLTEKLGFAMGRILLSYGINMNLAPVLDVANTKKGFLKSRSYSEDPEKVANLGTAFSRGLLDSGVLPTAKHFPGLGSVKGDPHKQVVQTDSSYKDFVSKDLIPFRKFSSLNPAAIMLSHAEYPSIDPSGSPATFSQKISTELLRNDLGFEGLVITDDLLMEGVAQESDFNTRLVKALKSGSDLLLFAWSPKSQKKAQTALLGAIKDGSLTEEWLDKKVARILEVKKILAEKQKVRNISSDPEGDYKLVMKKLQALPGSTSH